MERKRKLVCRQSSKKCLYRNVFKEYTHKEEESYSQKSSVNYQCLKKVYGCIKVREFQTLWESLRVSDCISLREFQIA